MTRHLCDSLDKILAGPKYCSVTLEGVNAVLSHRLLTDIRNSITFCRFCLFAVFCFWSEQHVNEDECGESVEWC